MNERPITPEGLWDASLSMEEGARIALHPQLTAFEPAIRSCYEAGVQVAALPVRVAAREHIDVAALFLKKTLTDLRAAWLVLRTGYTSPAAALVASLWENALSAAHISKHPESITALSPGADLPWGAQRLAKLSARDLVGELSSTTEKFELAWREAYASYKWLCKMKHPTLRSAGHDAFSAATGEGDYVVMAAPDIRSHDIANKAMLLAIASSRTFEALSAFVYATRCETSHDAYQTYDRLIQPFLQSRHVFSDAIKNSRIAFDVSDATIAAEYRELRRGRK